MFAHIHGYSTDLAVDAACENVSVEVGMQVVRQFQLPLLGGRPASVVQSDLPLDVVGEPDELLHVPVVLLVYVRIVWKRKGNSAREAAEQCGSAIHKVRGAAADGKHVFDGFFFVIVVVDIVVHAPFSLQLLQMYISCFCVASQEHHPWIRRGSQSLLLTAR